MVKYLAYIFIFLSFSCSKKKGRELDVSRLEAGDLILKMGYGQVSNLIVSVLKEDVSISHIGVIKLITKDSLAVIHSVSGDLAKKDGVQEESLKEFLKDCKPGSLYVLRHKKEKEKRNKVLGLAQSYLENEIPFDKEFDLNDKSKMYCSELIYHIQDSVFKQCFFNTKSIKDKNILLFNSLLKDTTNFTIVYSE